MDFADSTVEISRADGLERDTRPVRVRRGDGVLAIALAGDWTVDRAHELEAPMRKSLRAIVTRDPGSAIVLDASAVTRIDTAGTWLISQTVRQLAASGCKVSLLGLNNEQRELLAEVDRSSVSDPPVPPKSSGIVAAIGSFGATVEATARDLLSLVGFLGLVTGAVLRAVTFRSRFRWTSFVHHLEHAGLRAVPIIALICLLIGAVVMQQGALQLATYGAEPYAASMLGVLALREVGVLLTAVMVAGRSASAFTAEIGSMKMREEIAAMRTIGIDPVETLVVPRVLALLVAMPLLTLVGDIMCLVGGAAVAVFYLDQSLATYLERLQAAAEPRHLVAGLIKTPFAALVIALVGCSEGLKVEGSAESLGLHVTRAVVKAIFLVIVLGALFAMFLVSAGI